MFRPWPCHKLKENEKNGAKCPPTGMPPYAYEGHTNWASLYGVCTSLYPLPKDCCWSSTCQWPEATSLELTETCLGIENRLAGGQHYMAKYDSIQLIVYHHIPLVHCSHSELFVRCYSLSMDLSSTPAVGRADRRCTVVKAKEMRRNC